MLKRLILIALLTFAAAPAVANETTLRDHYVSVLQDEGYEEIRITRTLLGRLRFVAYSPRYRREIVVNPITGVVMRDYIRLLARSNQDRDDDDNGGYDDDDDDDYDDDDDDRDDDDRDDRDDD